MKTRHVTDSEVLAAVDAALAERGADYVYSNPYASTATTPAMSCLYVHGEETGCLVGNVMHRLGVPLDALQRWEGVRASTVMRRAEADLGIVVPAWSRYMLSRAQAQQDHGEEWGEAIAEGKAYASQHRKMGAP